MQREGTPAKKVLRKRLDFILKADFKRKENLGRELERTKLKMEMEMKTMENMVRICRNIYHRQRKQETRSLKHFLQVEHGSMIEGINCLQRQRSGRR